MKRTLCFLFALLISLASFAQCKIKTTQSMVDKTTTLTSQETMRSYHKFNAIISPKDTTYQLITALIIPLQNRASIDSIALKMLTKDNEVRQLMCKVGKNSSDVGLTCPVNKNDIPFMLKPMAYIKIGDEANLEYSLEKKPMWGKWFSYIQNSVKCISTELKRL